MKAKYFLKISQKNVQQSKDLVYALHKILKPLFYDLKYPLFIYHQKLVVLLCLKLLKFNPQKQLNIKNSKLELKTHSKLSRNPLKIHSKFALDSRITISWLKTLGVKCLSLGIPVNAAAEQSSLNHFHGCRPIIYSGFSIFGTQGFLGPKNRTPPRSLTTASVAEKDTLSPRKRRILGHS